MILIADCAERLRTMGWNSIVRVQCCEGFYLDRVMGLKASGPKLRRLAMPFWMLASVTKGLSSAAWLRRRHLGPLGPPPPLVLISLLARSSPIRRKLKKETEACCRNTFRIVGGHHRGALRLSPGIRFSPPLTLNRQEALVRLLGARFEIATLRHRPHIPH